MQPKASIVHLPVYQPGKTMEAVKAQYGLDNIIKLASNENPFGCSAKVKEAVVSELENTPIYPDGAALKLTAAMAESLGVEMDQLIFGAGSDEVILMIARAFLVAGDETVMAEPTFSQYKHNAEIEGAISIEVPLQDGKHDLDAMLARVGERTKIVWICNPNNPTGTIVSHAEVASFMQAVPAHVLVVLDEAYIEYVVDPEYPDGLSLLKQYKNLILLRTFSKAHGLASLRIGYGIGHVDVIRSVNQVRPPFNTTRMAQSAAFASLQDTPFIEECRIKNQEGLAYLQSEFDRMGLSYFPAHGNFIMVHLNKPADQVFERLLRQGIIVRSGNALGFPQAIRVTVGSRVQNEAFIQALEKTLKEWLVEV